MKTKATRLWPKWKVCDEQLLCNKPQITQVGEKEYAYKPQFMDQTVYVSAKLIIGLPDVRFITQVTKCPLQISADRRAISSPLYQFAGVSAKFIIIGYDWYRDCFVMCDANISSEWSEMVQHSFNIEGYPKSMRRAYRRRTRHERRQLRKAGRIGK